MANVVAFSDIDLSDYIVEDPGSGKSITTTYDADEVNDDSKITDNAWEDPPSSHTHFSGSKNIVFSEIDDIQDFVIDAASLLCNTTTTSHVDGQETYGIDIEARSCDDEERRDVLPEVSAEHVSDADDRTIAPSVRSRWGIGNHHRRLDYEVASSVDDDDDDGEFIVEEMLDSGNDKSVSDEIILEKENLGQVRHEKTSDDRLPPPLRRSDGMRRVAGPSLHAESARGTFDGPPKNDETVIDINSSSSNVEFHEDVESVPESDGADTDTLASFQSSAGNAQPSYHGDHTARQVESAPRAAWMRSSLQPPPPPAVSSSHARRSMEDKSIQVGTSGNGIGTQVSYDEERRVLFDADDIRTRLIQIDFLSWFSGKKNSNMHSSSWSWSHDAHAIPPYNRRRSVEADVTATAAELRFYQQIDVLRHRLASLACGKDIV